MNMDAVKLIQATARVLCGMLTPAPLTDAEGPLAWLTRFASEKTTITVMSSWKWRWIPRSIFLRPEYLISRFFAASCSTSRIAIPCTPINIRVVYIHSYRLWSSESNKKRGWGSHCGNDMWTMSKAFWLLKYSDALWLLIIGLLNGSHRQNLVYSSSLLNSLIILDTHRLWILKSAIFCEKTINVSKTQRNAGNQYLNDPHDSP